MKKTIRVLSLVMVLVMVLGMGMAMADAPGNQTGGAFQLLSTYPKDGAVETSMENMGVKLYFNKEMTTEKLGESNKDNFTLVDPDGNKLPLRVLYAPKEEGVVLVLLDTAKIPEGVKIQANAEYTLNISADVVDDNGDVLGTPAKITFTTQNQTRNNLVNTILMFVMMGGMIVFTMKGSLGKNKDDDDKKKKDNGPVNPYKEAKRTGKSVEEIVAKDMAKKDKAALREQKEAEKEAKMLAEYGYIEEDYLNEDYVEEGHYRVGRPRTVASAGSTYITGNKAKYEAMLERKAKEEKWAREAKKKGKKK